MEGKYDDRACSAILDAAKTIYQEEQDRFKQAETKANITLGFSGVILGVFITYLSHPIIKFKCIYFMIYSDVINLIILILITGGILFFLLSLNVGKYQEAGLKNIVTFEFASENGNEAKLRIAGTYNEAIKKNKDAIDKKFKRYSIGLYLILIGSSIFFINFIIEEIVSIATK